MLPWISHGCQFYGLVQQQKGHWLAQARMSGLGRVDAIQELRGEEPHFAKGRKGWLSLPVLFPYFRRAPVRLFSFVAAERQTMFEAIRKHSKFVMILLFLLIIPSFVFVGINQNYFSESSATVARVDGQDIKQSDWDNAVRVESDRMRTENPTVDAKLFDTPQFRYATLEKMVRERVIAAAAQKQHLTASDEQLVHALQSIPAIAALRKPDGSLDDAAYAALVGSQGMTPAGFESNLRYELSMGQVLGGVSSSVFATPSQVQQAMDALYQRREIQLAHFDAASFAAKVQPTEADLKGYYDAHSAQFQQPEQLSAEYVELTMADAEAAVTISDEELQSYYKQNAQRLGGPEERRVSHILFTASPDASKADQDKAKAAAEQALAEVRKDPKRFGEVAKAQSQDTSSASQGGDLGMISRGKLANQPFEDAVFALKAGEISDVVHTDFGYHIIEVIDIKKPEAPSFESVRSKLLADLKQQQAKAKFAELGEAFRNMVYEQSDSLQPVADKLHLTVRKADHIARDVAPDAKGALASQSFVQKLYDSVQSKNNTDAVQLPNNDLVAGRVTAHAAARTLPMEEVADQVRKAFTAQKAMEMARAEGEAKLKAWQADAAGAALEASKTVSRQQAQDLPIQVVDAAMSAPIASLPYWSGVDLGSKGYVIVKVNKVLPAPAAQAQQQEQQKAQYTQWLALAEVMAYYEELKKQYKVQIKVPQP